MTQYKPKPKAAWCDQLECDIDPQHVTVFEQDDGAPTGLYDKDGCELMRYVRIKLGFIK